MEGVDCAFVCLVVLGCSIFLGRSSGFVSSILILEGVLKLNKSGSVGLIFIFLRGYGFCIAFDFDCLGLFGDFSDFGVSNDKFSVGFVIDVCYVVGSWSQDCCDKIVGFAKFFAVEDFGFLFSGFLEFN